MSDQIQRQGQTKPRAVTLGPDPRALHLMISPPQVLPVGPAFRDECLVPSPIPALEPFRTPQGNRETIAGRAIDQPLDVDLLGLAFGSTPAMLMNPGPEIAGACRHMPDLCHISEDECLCSHAPTLKAHSPRAKLESDRQSHPRTHP